MFKDITNSSILHSKTRFIVELLFSTVQYQNKLTCVDLHTTLLSCLYIVTVQGHHSEHIPLLSRFSVQDDELVSVG